MANADETRETPNEAPNPRRGERREAPVIEGTAEEAPPVEAASGADDDRLADAVRPADATRPAEAAPPPSPRARRSAAISFAALGAAVLALALGAYAAWRSVDAGAGRQALASQIAALDHRLDAVTGAQRRLDALEQKVAQLAAARSADAAAGAATRAQAQRALALAKQAGASAAGAVRLAKGADPAALAAMQKQIAKLAARPDPAALAATFAQDLAAQNKQIAAVGERAAATQMALAALSAKAAAQSKRMKPLEAMLHAPKLDVAAIKAGNAKALDQAGAAAFLVVARQLQREIDAGRPFAKEVAALRAPAALGALGQFSSGVPTAAELRQKFAPLAGPILAGVPQREAHGVIGQLASGLGKLVTIRTIGKGAAGDPAALVGQIEGALARGDVASALRARDRLPPAAKKITADWAAGAKKKMAADAAARALLDAALAKLAKAGP